MDRLRGIAFAGLLLATTASGASAQGFNVDMGVLTGTPPDSYGGAAGQTGHWGGLVGGDTVPTTLTGLDGLPTGVTISEPLPFSQSALPGLLASIDDDALMDDYYDLHSTPAEFEIAGLAPGTYTVYTYAWAPDDPAYMTVVNVHIAGTDLVDADSQWVGGEWPGSQTLGVTYARHVVTLAPGESLGIYTFGLGAGTLNGIQIVPAPGCAADLDGDGDADVFDLLAYLTDWFAQAPAADLDGNPGVDVFDLLTYLGGWFAGC